MFKLRKEKMEEIKNVLLQLSSNGNRMTGESERQRLQSKKASNRASAYGTPLDGATVKVVITTVNKT